MAAGTTWPNPLRAVVARARTERASASRASSGPLGTGSGASSSTGTTGSGSASASNSSQPSCTAPSPSVKEWWSLTTSAAVPSARPSTSVMAHSGRNGSNSVMASDRANSSTVSGVCGCGASIRRRCIERSTSQSTQRGVANSPGGLTGRCRNRGARRVARSRRAVRTSTSGGDPSQTTPTMVDRRPGSCSMFQVSASVWRMNCWSYRAMVPPSPPLVKLGRWHHAVQGRRSPTGAVPLTRGSPPACRPRGPPVD